MAITPEQAARLMQIIRDSSTALAITTAGYEVPAEELERLRKEGYLPEEGAQDFVLDSFALGQLLQHEERARTMPFHEFTEWLKRHPVALSPQERNAVEIARRRAGTYCVGLGNRYSSELGTTLINADQELAQRTRQIIRDATARKLEERTTVKQLKSELGKLTGDWARDWDRIAHSESHMAHQEGFLNSVQASHGDEADMAKIPEPDACKHCKRLYLEDGKPMVRPLSWWQAQGVTNAGRKVAEWKAVSGGIHPWCRCPLVRVPKGWSFNDNWNLVPGAVEKSDGAVQSHGATRGSWHPIPRTKHPGGQRRWAGDHWEYRYPQPGGGHASTPAPDVTAEPLATTQPATGSTLEMPWDANPARRRKLLVDAQQWAWQAMEFHADDPKQRQEAEQRYPPEAKRLSEHHSKKELDAFAERINAELWPLQKYKGLNPRVLDPDFKAWFGDWEKGDGSKVLKAEGEPAEMWGSKPIAVYHGTPMGGFRYFDKGKDKGYNIFGKGFYFTEDEGIASEYIRKDEDDVSAGITHYTDHSGKEVTHLLKGDTAPLLRSATTRKNPNFDPSIAWAVVRAEEPEGVNIHKLIQEYWNPTGRQDPKVVQQVMDRVAELDPDATKSFTWNGKYLREHFEAPERHSTSSSVYGAKQLHQALQKQNPGMIGVAPKPEVFECYLRIRKPIDMDKPVDRGALNDLSKYLLQQEISRKVATVAAYEAELARPDISDYRKDQAQSGLARATHDIESAKKQGVAHAYADDLIDQSVIAAGLPGIHDNYNVEVAYEPMLRLKQHLVSKTKGVKSLGKQVLGLLHASDSAVLTWGDVHYIVTNAHGYEIEKQYFRNWGESAGYDGVAHTGGWNVGHRDHRVWIAWEPTQIKSVKAAEFDSKDPDIYKAVNKPLYLGPRGGHWADPEHTVHWEPSTDHPQQAAAVESDSARIDRLGDKIWDAAAAEKSWVRMTEALDVLHKDLWQIEYDLTDGRRLVRKDIHTRLDTLEKQFMAKVPKPRVMKVGGVEFETLDAGIEQHAAELAFDAIRLRRRALDEEKTTAGARQWITGLNGLHPKVTSFPDTKTYEVFRKFRAAGGSTEGNDFIKWKGKSAVLKQIKDVIDLPAAHHRIFDKVGVRVRFLLHPSISTESSAASWGGMATHDMRTRRPLILIGEWSIFGSEGEEERGLTVTHELGHILESAVVNLSEDRDKAPRWSKNPMLRVGLTDLVGSEKSAEVRKRDTLIPNWANWDQEWFAEAYRFVYRDGSKMKTTLQGDDFDHAAFRSLIDQRIAEAVGSPRHPITEDAALLKSHKLHARLRFQGFPISVENRVGSIRKWHNVQTGKDGETVMKNAYGYIRLTEGADGDHVDCFLGPDEKAASVYVVHTMRAPDFKTFDEDKCMLGFPSQEAAKAAYLAHYDDLRFLGSITSLPVEVFRHKVYRIRRKMIKARPGQQAIEFGSAPPVLEPVDELALWTKAVTAVGIRPEDFRLVVKYAKLGHPDASKMMERVKAEFEKATIEMGSTKDPSTIGTMGFWGGAARTSGEAMRSSKVGPPEMEFPVGRADMQKPGRRQKRALPRAADKLDLSGATPGKSGFSRPPRINLLTTTTKRVQVPITQMRENVARQQQIRIESREGGHLTDLDIHRP